MRFIIKLLPLLLQSQLPSAHIVSIFAAGKESALFPSDLSLRSPAHYSASNSRSHVVHMTTLFFEKLAEKHRGRLALINVFPGLVITEGFADKRLPAWFRLMWFLATPLTPLFSIKGREVGDRVLFLATELFPARRAVVDDVGKGRGVSSAAEGEARVAIGTDGNRGSGAYSVNWDGESIHVDNKYQKLREEGFAEKVWEHTIRAFEDIEAGRTFTD